MQVHAFIVIDINNKNVVYDFGKWFQITHTFFVHVNAYEFIAECCMKIHVKIK